MYTETDLTSFGNYLLSEERKERIINKEAVGNQVTHADFENWKLKKD